MSKFAAKATREPLFSGLSPAGAAILSVAALFVVCAVLPTPSLAAEPAGATRQVKPVAPTDVAKSPKGSLLSGDAPDNESYPIGRLLLKFSKPQMACKTRVGATMVNLLGNEEIDKAGRERMMRFAMRSCSLLATENALEVVGVIAKEGIIEVRLLDSDETSPIYIPVNSMKEDEMAMALRVDPALAKELGNLLGKLPSVAPKGDAPKDLRLEKDAARILRI